MTTNRIARRVAGTIVALAALSFAGAATAAPGTAPMPVFANVSSSLGTHLPTFLQAPSMKLLTSQPDTVFAGGDVTVAGKGLPASRDVQLTWSTADVNWLLDARPDSVDYLGRSAASYNIQLGIAHTDATGAFNLTVRTPRDWGGLHDIYALVDGVAVAKGGLLIARHATISPKSGPIGTPITITYYGLGSKLYEGSASMTYDNKFVGQLTANWNRGVAVAHIRAAGPVGRHVIVLTDAVTYSYMNIPQSPNPWATASKLYFTVTKDAGRPKPAIDWPVNVAPTMWSYTTMLPEAVKGAKVATGALSTTTGSILTKVGLTASGLTPDAPVDIQWASVVGNRVNCTGTCWTTLNIPLSKAKAGADGSLKTAITVPDGLGGWHAVQLLQGGQVKAQLPFFVKRSFESAQPVSDLTLRPGQHFTIHLKGLGWTQLDNTIAVDYDNAYIGYACGFNSQGDTVINLTATGAPGTHLIDMYPLLYTQQPSYPNTPYGMIPLLSYRTDLPGLALGYPLPAMRLAITVVK